jgi:hypothetical protein
MDMLIPLQINFAIVSLPALIKETEAQSGCKGYILCYIPSETASLQASKVQVKGTLNLQELRS